MVKRAQEVIYNVRCLQNRDNFNHIITTYQYTSYAVQSMYRFYQHLSMFLLIKNCCNLVIRFWRHLTLSFDLGELF